ncbi:hypothetical protein CCACVL1_25194 [Corchorus capsularis]|uniref:Uncharacterized protein n=1 Tax=Corchorus capsularis TaxID=210143 RepID=A0A1R3GLP6_COCAP|nr:hypothetical protein CCACVL1_25194 [Corchorus capsularis]
MEIYLREEISSKCLKCQSKKRSGKVQGWASSAAYSLPMTPLPTHLAELAIRREPIPDHSSSFNPNPKFSATRNPTAALHRAVY